MNFFFMFVRSSIKFTVVYWCRTSSETHDDVEAVLYKLRTKSMRVQYAQYTSVFIGIHELYLCVH